MFILPNTLPLSSISIYPPIYETYKTDLSKSADLGSHIANTIDKIPDEKKKDYAENEVFEHVKFIIKIMKESRFKNKEH